MDTSCSQHPPADTHSSVHLLPCTQEFTPYSLPMKLTGPYFMRFSQELLLRMTLSCPASLTARLSWPYSCVHLWTWKAAAHLYLSYCPSTSKIHTVSLQISLLYKLNLIIGGLLKQAFLRACYLSFLLCTCQEIMVIHVQVSRCLSITW